MKFAQLSFFFILISLLSSCKESSKPYSPPENLLFIELSSKETGIDFINEVTDTDSFNVITFRNFYNGGGVGIGDINNDGLADIYFTSNSGKNRLYLNKGNFQFENITDKAGVGGTQAWSTGVTLADVNADGWLDIYVCNSGNIRGDKRENELFINQKNLTFKEEAARYGLNDKGLSTHASFFDYDTDGDLDCYVLNNSFKQTRKFDYTKDLRSVRDASGGDKLYQNDNGHFTDVSEKANIYGSEIGFGLGISVGDVNGDKYPDMYISNDLFERDYLYINQKNGTFHEVLTEQMGHVSINSMGADLADINNDGWPDIFSTDMLPEDEYRLKTNVKFDEYEITGMKHRSTYHYQYLKNMLQINNGDGTFSELGSFAGVDATDWSWGALTFDFENDGWKDIFVSNGMYKDITDMDYIEFLTDRESVKEIIVKEGKFNHKNFVDKASSVPIPNYAFVNQHNLKFINQAQQLGLGKPGFSNGAAYGDLDNDGDLDLVVNNLFTECSIYRNEAGNKTGNNYLKLKLQGNKDNSFGIGAEAIIYYQNQFQVLQQMPARGFQSSVEPVLNFGLGKAGEIDSLVIIWPDLQMQVQRNIEVNQVLILHQKDADLKFNYAPQVNTPVYTEVTNSTFVGNIEHKENPFVDFNYQRLMPRMLSTQGPKLAKGDINGDGLEDIFMGGARGDAGKVFLQTQGGQFKQLPQKEFEEDKEFEDIGAVFLDADGDKDLDLLIGSGGNEYEVGTEPLAVRLYLNDGRANFKASPERSPGISVNASCVVACDFDKDGDEDVFIGGRSIPGSYGLTPQSYLLENDNGIFKNNTPTELQQIGMVTDAVWEDYDKDGKKDLIVVGEWMPITFFRNNGKMFSKALEVSNSNGWWNKIIAADLDQDGDMDFVAGNWGLNTKFKASLSRPITMYVKDFDQNGRNDFIITQFHADGKSYPYHSKRDVTTLMPVLKKKFLKYKDYAGKTYEEIFNEHQKKDALKKEVFTLSTSVLINNGNGSFALQPLPFQAQISPVFGILAEDINGDSITDIFLGGNFYGVKPEIGRSDASYGVMFIGSGNNQFNYIPPKQSGIFIKGEVRDIVSINTANKNPIIIFSKNNDKMQAFKNISHRLISIQ